MRVDVDTHWFHKYTYLERNECSTRSIRQMDDAQEETERRKKETVPKSCWRRRSGNHNFTADTTIPFLLTRTESSVGTMAHPCHYIYIYPMCAAQAIYSSISVWYERTINNCFANRQPLLAANREPKWLYIVKCVRLRGDNWIDFDRDSYFRNGVYSALYVHVHFLGGGD